MLKEVGKRMGFAEQFEFETAVDVFREHARLSAFENHGERDFDISALADITEQEYASLQPIQWPITDNAPQAQPECLPITIFTPLPVKPE